MAHFTLLVNFWSSAEIINLINYFCFNLYCIVLLLCYAQYLILETVVLTFVYLYCVICFVCVLCVLFSDKFHVRLLYDRMCGPTKYVCMYACTYISSSYNTTD
jgi:hypothetical protein